MLDRLFNSPLTAFAFLFFVVVLVMVYFAQRERAKVNQMRGMRRFSPGWSSGRRHYRGRPGGRAEFNPQWSKRSRTGRSGTGPGAGDPRGGGARESKGPPTGPQGGSDPSES